MDQSAYTPEVVEKLTTAYAYLLASKYHGLASSVMLFYDHSLTFADEIKYMWKRRKSFTFWLFLIFRYASFIVTLVNLFASHDPRWIGNTCLQLESPSDSLLRRIPATLVLRVHAIYSEAAWVLWLTIPVFVGHLVVLAWAVPAGAPAILPPGFIGCMPKPKPGTGLPLVFDSTMFALTLGRAIYYRLTGSLIPLITLIIRDGTLYFAVIFVVNLTNVFMMALAPPGLGVINAPFASMIRTILMSRLMINLRVAADAQLSPHPSSSDGRGQPIFSPHATQTLSQFHAVGGSSTTAFYRRIGADEFVVPLPDRMFGLEEDQFIEWMDDTHEEYEME
ncbi:hypothetical protein L218DRAFT_947356 [Marasmius fiardii PR-910]|nr:hypothetical protein L218DRAFT_947356 [Marasmius fiardii PR-910]